MANDKLVEVNLQTDFRDDDDERTLYTAGPNALVPQSVADRLESGQQDAAAAAAFDSAGANRDELEAEADRRGMTVKGSGKDGYVTAEDYRGALA